MLGHVPEPLGSHAFGDGAQRLQTAMHSSDLLGTTHAVSRVSNHRCSLWGVRVQSKTATTAEINSSGRDGSRNSVDIREPSNIYLFPKCGKVTRLKSCCSSIECVHRIVERFDWIDSLNIVRIRYSVEERETL